MSDWAEIHPDHPLFRELRTKLLWHCTGAAHFRSIRADGCIRPVAGQSNRWGNRPYACQTLGAVCLFDFASESVETVLGAADRWHQFVVGEQPVTVLLGIEERKLPGRVVRYPETKDTTPSTSSGPIAWVEACHVGPIPTSAIVSHLLVCPIDHAQFSRHGNLDEETLVAVENRFAEVCRQDKERRSRRAAEVRAVMESPEFKSRLERARQSLGRSRTQQ